VTKFRKEFKELRERFAVLKKDQATQVRPLSWSRGLAQLTSSLTRRSFLLAPLPDRLHRRLGLRC
jgi:hypothetical protein